MTAFAFLCGILFLFALLVAWEAEPELRQRLLQPAGLWRWLTSGNWTAKVGAGLLIVGSGALLRYLMLNVAFPSQNKLMAGAALSLLLGTGSAALASAPPRRAIRLALGGAALGVAYLTAYSAYGLFHYVTSIEGGALLFAVACGATAYALSTGAVSIAVLAMLGAYCAPAFALRETGPIPVFGYYVLASAITALMVHQRGWRPLIHLSFLFTLAGGLFFGWSERFYTPTYYGQMQPLLLVLVAIHLALPFLERKQPAADIAAEAWLQRFDLGYFLLLPAVALLLTLLIAPDLERHGALGVLALAGLWAAAGFAAGPRSRAEGLRYHTLALLLLLAAGALALGGVSSAWLAAIALSAVLSFAGTLQIPRGLEGFLVSLLIAASACYALQALYEPVIGLPLLNVDFLRHAVLAAALAIVGLRLKGRSEAMVPVFRSLAHAWLIIATGRELVRFHFEHVPQILHGLSLAAVAAYAVRVRWKPPALVWVLVLGAIVFVTGVIAADGFLTVGLVGLMLAGQLLFSLLALACVRHGEAGASAAGVARSLLPVVLFPMAAGFSQRLASPQYPVIMTLLAASALLASLQAERGAPAGRSWPNWLSPLGLVVFGCTLGFETWFNIEREPWQVAFELVALLYLLQTVRFLFAVGHREATTFSYLVAAAVASVAAAMLLRLVGPPGRLTIFALNDLLLPAVNSLVWAAVGCVLTGLSTRTRSRRQWSLGAVLLAASAVKLILFDFGSLGQLGNILATMAAGGVFLLVAWLAPFPPGETPSGEETAPVPEPSGQEGSSPAH